MIRRDKAFVLAIDPGSQHVGWSFGQGYDLIESGIDEPSNFLYGLEEMHEVYGPVQRLVVERFDLRQWTDDSVQTVKLIGAIEWIAAKHILHVAWVNAADKKKFIVSLPAELSSHARDAEAIRRWDLAYGIW